MLVKFAFRAALLKFRQRTIARCVESLEQRSLLAAVAWTGGTDNTSDFFPLNPTATFLRTSNDPLATAATPIALAPLGITPGMRIRLSRAGAYQYGPSQPDTAITTSGMLSSTGALAASNTLVRVTGSIASGLPPMTTITTFNGHLATNVPNNFDASGTVEVVVPTGAAYLFLAAHDEFYGDDVDPNADYGVSITTFLGNGSSWNDPFNWSELAVPTASDNVTIAVPDANPTFVVNSGSQAAHSLVSSENISILSGSLTLGGASTIYSANGISTGLTSPSVAT